MNNLHEDDFLYQNRPPIRKEFADGLYRRLSLEEKERKVFLTKQTSSWVWRFAVALMLIAALLFTLSTDVRANVLEWIKTVAGFQVDERAESPLKEAAQPTIYPVTVVHLPKALQNPPFSFGMPQYLPEGYQLQDDVGIASSESWISMVWENHDGSEIDLLVQKGYSENPIPVGVDSTREIQIHGQPALLIFGFWNENHAWDPDRSVALHWQTKDLHYTLTFWARYGVHGPLKPVEDIEAATEDLVKIAESIQE